ncbi:MAG: Crp/Fnr family transcriptional regulator [Alphaproteobacteria bacterium]
MVRRKAMFLEADGNDLDLIEGARKAFRTLPPRTAIYSEGERCDELYTVYSGWVQRYKMLRDGRRQILDFQLSGDFLGLQQDLTHHMDHSAETVTEVSLCVFPRSQLLELFKARPEIAWRLIWLAASEEAVLFEHLTDLGRRNATERIAHLLLEMFHKLRWRGEVNDDNSCTLPLTQQHIADALGLSTPHLNRTLRVMREKGLVTFSEHKLAIHDLDRLAKLCDYQNTYIVPRPMI